MTFVLFWVLLGLPGYALLRRTSPSSLDGGGPSTIALSYLASFALLTPVSLAGYALRLPIGVLSWSVVGMAAIAVASLVQARMRSTERLRWPELSPIALTAFAVLAADAVVGYALGTHPGGDAGFHVARIRWLLSSGFNGQDPLVPFAEEWVYRANLYHALLASAADLSSSTAWASWFHAWPWAKLVSACAAGHLAWVCFGQRWIAWTATATAALWNATYSVLPYPNTIAFTWLLPLSAAFCVEACTDEARSRQAALGLAATSVALGQTHPLYAVFMALTVGPALVLRAIFLLSRGGLRASTPMLVCGVGALLGAAWPLASVVSPPAPAPEVSPIDPQLLVDAREASMRDEDDDTGDDDDKDERDKDDDENDARQTKGADAEADSDRAEQPELERGFVRLQSGAVILSPQRWFSIHSEPGQLLVMLVLASVTRLRRRLWPLLVITGVVIACAHVPLITGFLVDAAGRAWIVRRLFGVVNALHLGLFPGIVFALLPHLPAVRALAAALSLGLAAYYGRHHEPWTIERTMQRLDDAWKEGRRDPSGERERFFDAAVPHGASVVMDPKWTYRVISSCDCFPFATAPGQGSRGRPDMELRREIADTLTDTKAPRDVRLRLLRHFQVNHQLVHKRDVRKFRKIYGPHLIATHISRRHAILVLDPSPMPARPNH